MLLAVLFFCLTYVGASMLGAGETHVLDPSPIDAGLPFLPWTLAVYASQVALVLGALWLAPSQDTLRNLLSAMAIAAVICLAIFMVWPSAIKRPDMRGLAFPALYFLDAPSNVLPSLSVALTVIAATLWPHGRSRPLVWIWAFAIVVSTLTTKQQLVASAAAGAFVGVVALVWSGAVERALRRATAH